MAKRETSGDPGRQRAAGSGRWSRLFLLLGLVTLLMVPALMYGRLALGTWGRYMAAQQLEMRAISSARQWLVWSNRFAPDDPRTNLLAARCFRHLRESDRFNQALESARKNGADHARIRQEVTLAELQGGQGLDRGERVAVDLIEAGVSPHDAAGALVYGYLYQEDTEGAKRVLDAWEADYPGNPNVAYMRGIYWQSKWEFEQAEAEFLAVLAKQPRHELTRIQLAELYEESLQRLDRSLEELLELARIFPTNEKVPLDLARVLRKMGHAPQAHDLLAPLASDPEAPAKVLLEMSEIELDLGNYQRALQLQEQAGFAELHDFQRVLAETMAGDTLVHFGPQHDEFLRARAAATAMALDGRGASAEQLFAEAFGRIGSLRRMIDLHARLGVNPRDQEAAEELQQLIMSTSTLNDASFDEESPVLSGPQLYAAHCAACHGDAGDGQGRAARHLFPRPRDFRSQRFRLVSTENAVPSREDVVNVIKHGMPGASMPSFEQLSDEEQGLLADEVLQMFREGVRDRIVEVLGEGDDVEDRVRPFVEQQTVPGAAVSVPSFEAADLQAVARGREVFFQLNCHQCHGTDGSGVGHLYLYDDTGQPTQPRDLARDPFKGGHEPESIYLRTLLGMPGTPHPASTAAAQDQLTDLVHFCLSLSQEPKRSRTNHERAIQAATGSGLPR